MIEQYSKHIVYQFNLHFLNEAIDDDEYFASINNIIKGIECYCEAENIPDPKIETLKNITLVYAFELFKKEWLTQALIQDKEDDDYIYDEKQEIEECMNIFYSWFKEEK